MKIVSVGFETENLYHSLIELPGGSEAVSCAEARHRFENARQRLLLLPENWAIIIDSIGNITDEIQIRKLNLNELSFII